VSFPGGIAIVCAASILAGYLCSRIRSMPPGICMAVIASVAASYVLAWAVMSPMLHPNAGPPGGWDLVATMAWSSYGVPAAIAGYAFFRWRQRRSGDAR